MSENPRVGRHRSPKRHNPIAEIAGIVRDASPSTRGLAVVAATGGLVGAFTQPAQAESVVAAPAAVALAPAVVGPSTHTPSVTSAVSTIGFAPAKPTAAAPLTLVDHVHEAKVKAAADKAAAEKAAAAKAASEAAAKAKAQKAATAKAAAEKAATARTSSTAASRTSTRTSVSTTSKATSSTSSTTSKSTSSASRGATSATNWATRGQCTWGALNLWHQATGFYIGGFYGNALTWGYKAASVGYTVKSTPRARSIVVMQPGVHGSSGAGHVGWVTSVSGNKVTITEMNALAGPGRYNTRTITHTGGMQYIYAP